MNKTQIKQKAENMIAAQIEESGCTREEVLEVSTYCFVEEYIKDGISREDLVALSNYLETPLNMEEVEILKQKRKKQAEYRLNQKARKLIEKLRNKVKKHETIERWLLECIVVNYLHEYLEKGKINFRFFVKTVEMLDLKEEEKKKITHQPRSEEQIKDYAQAEIQRHRNESNGNVEEIEETAMVMTSYRYECGYLYRDEFVKIARYYNYELDIDAIDKYFREEVPIYGVGMYHSTQEYFRKISKGEK